VKLSWSHFTVSLARPIRNATGTWTRRTGVRVQLRDHGLLGEGEATPLPGYSPDNCDMLERALSALSAKLPTLQSVSSIHELCTTLRAAWPEATPAAWFALETAWLDLQARRANLPVHHLLRGTSELRRPIALTRLLETAAPEHWADAAGTAVACGYRSVKLKLGAADFEREHAALVSLRERIGYEIALRLDVNGAWTLAEAEARLPRLAALQPEFVEEPCRSERLEPLRHCGVALALDESLAAPAALGRVTQSAVKVLVLKPALLGGYAACAEWSALARSLGLGVVITHCFDGPIALAAACEIALTLGDMRACGLDRYASLSDWADAAVPQLQPPWLVPARITGVRADSPSITAAISGVE
jgi:L-Ala-D/L-Glu epimerase